LNTCHHVFKIVIVAQTWTRKEVRGTSRLFREEKGVQVPQPTYAKSGD